MKTPDSIIRPSTGQSYFAGMKQFDQAPPAAAPSIPVFVYGTLKRGKSNHRLLDHPGARFLRASETADKFPLVVDGLPFLHNRPGEGEHVKGEAYLVDAQTLEQLDRLEGHPRFYKREEIRIRAIGGKSRLTMRAWCYFIQSRKLSRSEKTHAEF